MDIIENKTGNVLYCNVTLRRLPVTVVAMEKQQLLHIRSVCVCVSVRGVCVCVLCGVVCVCVCGV